MSVNTSGGPLPEVRDAAINNGTSNPSRTTRTTTENPRLRDSVDTASSINDEQDRDRGMARSTTVGSSNKEKPTKWYQYLGRGMYQDVRNRLPFYVSDWTDAWNYRVVPATLVSSFGPLAVDTPCIDTYLDPRSFSLPTYVTCWYLPQHAIEHVL